MSIWNKVLIVLILLASGAFFYLAARALKTHQYWRQQALQTEKALEAERSSEDELTEQKRQLSLALHRQLLNRGRVWQRCAPQPRPETVQTGEVAVVTEFPNHQIKVQTVLWVFDEADVKDGGSYLGQFTVASIGGQDERMLQLQPSMQISAPQRQQLQQSASRNGASWALYEVMPVDTHEAFAELDEQQLKDLLPGSSLEDYLSDGQIMTAEEVKTQGMHGKVLAVDETGEIVKGVVEVKNDDGIDVEVEVPMQQEIDKGKGKFVRQLRDYEELFLRYHLRWAKWVDEMQSATRSRDYVTAAKQDADRQFQYRQKERDQLAQDKKTYLSEKDMASAHRQALQQTLDTVQKAILATIQANQALAGEIARIQREATRIIDEQTRRVARARRGE